MNNGQLTMTKTPDIRSDKVIERINATALALLEQNPEGLYWSEMIAKIESADHAFHPKTVNGCIWKLVQHYPDRVYKPAKGLFRLLKYKE
jgi:hypothetical protein